MNVELWLAVDNTYQRALTIPFGTTLRFSLFPLTWLRLLGFTICGRQGYISNTANGPEIDTYRPTGPPDNQPPVIQPGIYYYVVAGDAGGDSCFWRPFTPFTQFRSTLV
jgi:hypothetical protein